VFPDAKTTALIGASGSNKSTAVALVKRFYHSRSGTASILATWVFVSSEARLVSSHKLTLFATTICGNVEHGMIVTEVEHLNDEGRMEKVGEACVKTNAQGFITQLPYGCNTLSDSVVSCCRVVKRSVSPSLVLSSPTQGSPARQGHYRP
jgi:ATP-binding cassette, subfamily B (MDR/TAP), member 1